MSLRFGVTVVLVIVVGALCGGVEDSAPPTTESRPASVTKTPVATPASGSVVVELEDWGPEAGTRGTVTLRDVPRGLEVGLAVDHDVELVALGPLEFWDDDCQWEYNNSYVGGDGSAPILILDPSGRHWRTTIPQTSMKELGAASIGFGRMLFLCGNL